MSRSAAPVWSADPDEELLDNGQIAKAAEATVIANEAARRGDLRASIERSVSHRLTATDLAVLCAIGALGAVPATSFDDRVLAGLRLAVGGMPDAASGFGADQMRQMLHDGLADGSLLTNVPGLAGLLAGGGQGGGAIASSLLASGGDGSLAGGAAGFAVPDAEDVIETGLTRLMSDKYCEYRGWKEGEQVYHEAKTIAYAVTAIVSAPFNPNPVAFALAAWHGVKVLWLSGQMTVQVVELARLAVAAGQAEIAALERELSSSRDVDGFASRLAAADPGWGSAIHAAADEAALAAFDVGNMPRRTRWTQ